MELISIQVKIDCSSELLYVLFYLNAASAPRKTIPKHDSQICHIWWKSVVYYAEVSHFQLSNTSSIHLGLSKTEHTSFLTGWDMHARTCVLWMWHISLLFYMLLCSHHRWSLNIFAGMSVDIFGKVKHSGLNKTLYLAPRWKVWRPFAA